MTKLINIKQFIIPFIVIIISLIVFTVYHYQTTVSVEVKKWIVVDKVHKPPYTTTQMTYTGKIFVPVIIHHPERFILYLQTNIFGTEINKKIFINELIYNETKINGYINHKINIKIKK